MRVEAAVLIGADPATVFRFIAAVENGPRWQEGAISTRVTTSGPVRLGSEIEHVGRWLGIRIPTRGVVTVFERDAAFGYDITSALSATPSRMRYALAPMAQGTKLTLATEATLPRVMVPLAPLLRRSVQRMFERDVTRLRNAIETADTAADAVTT
jgi:hypothetical protein